MANFIIDPITGITIPTPGAEPGPLYATDVSNALSKLSHLTHTGQSNLDGYQIPSAGLNINADVPFQSNNIIGLRSSRFNSQSGTLVGAGDINCVYVDQGNLYFNNGSGTPIPITSGSIVNVTTSQIYNSTSTSANLTIPTNAPYSYINVNASAIPITITLPTASSVPAGRFFIVKDTFGGALTHNITVRTSGDTMDAGSQYALTQNYQSVGFVGDGASNWSILYFDKPTYVSGDTLTFNNGAQAHFAGTSTLQVDTSASATLTGTTLITGPFTINPGSNAGFITIPSSGSLTTNGPINGNNLININSGATLNVQGGSTFNIRTSPFLTNSSILNVDAGSALTLASGSAINLNSGSSLNITSATTSIQSSFILITSNSILQASSGSTVAVASDGYLVNHGKFTTDTWAQWGSTQIRTLTDGLSDATILNGGPTTPPYLLWTPQTASCQIKAEVVNGQLSKVLTRLHNKATMTSVKVGFKVGQLHTGVPSILPNFFVNRTNVNTGAVDQLNGSNSPAFFPTPASGSSYYNSGTLQFITYTCNVNNVIDNSQYVYTLYINDEGGANPLPGNFYSVVVMNFGNITDQSWSI